MSKETREYAKQLVSQMTLEEKMLQDFSPEETAQFAEFLSRAYRNVGGRII